MYSNIGNSGLNDYLGSSTDPCYIQNRVITNRVIKRSCYKEVEVYWFSWKSRQYRLVKNTSFIVNFGALMSAPMCCR